MDVEMSSAKYCPFGLSLGVLEHIWILLMVFLLCFVELVWLYLLCVFVYDTIMQTIRHVLCEVVTDTNISFIHGYELFNCVHNTSVKYSK